MTTITNTDLLPQIPAVAPSQVFTPAADHDQAAGDTDNALGFIIPLPFPPGLHLWVEVGTNPLTVRIVLKFWWNELGEVTISPETPCQGLRGSVGDLRFELGFCLKGNCIIIKGAVCYKTECARVELKHCF